MQYTQTNARTTPQNPTQTRTESESESEEEELELLLDEEEEDEEEEDEEEVLSSSDSAPAASWPRSFSSPMKAAGSARYCASSPSCALAALFSLFFIRLNDRSFPGDIFLAVPSFAWGMVVGVCGGGAMGWAWVRHAANIYNPQTPKRPNNNGSNAPSP